MHQHNVRVISGAVVMLALLSACGADLMGSGAGSGPRATVNPLFQPPTPLASALVEPSSAPAQALAPLPTVDVSTVLPATAAPTAAPTVAPVPSMPPQNATPAPPAGTDFAELTLELQAVAAGLTAPVGLANAGDGSGRLFVVEKRGWISIVAAGQLRETPFLDIQELVEAGGSEQGLLGLAFHPLYLENGRFFVAYTDVNGDQVVARYQVSSDPDRADPSSAMIILQMDDPAGNHNGGGLAFGPDGYLYIGTGDGGGAGDSFGTGQNADTLLAKMLRLDVDSAEPYAIPADNPYRATAGVRPEIWSAGLRNPWRFSFDRATGDLYIADVGQNAFEEINMQPASSRGGENYGWPITEATHCFPEGAQCSADGLTMPIGEYSHDFGCSVTGGYVYRGSAFPQLAGAYVFADYCSGLVFGLARSADGVWSQRTLAETGLRITTFGEDEAGELYLVALNDSTLYRVIVG